MAGGDFIETWLAMTDGAFSPQVFRLWSAISMTAGALERRVWTKIGPPRTYANLYVLLVGVPGIGKQVVENVRELMKEAKQPGTKLPAFHVAPNQMTKASMLDTLAKAKAVRILKDGLLQYHSLMIAAEEFQVLLPSYDQEFIATLNYLFNSPNLPYEEVRRTGSVKDFKIELPQVNILAGVQPSYFVSTFPEEAWTTGFARRIIMVYASETPQIELFQEDRPEASKLREWLLNRLNQMSQLYGQMIWAPDAALAIKDWHRAKSDMPTHSKLIHYNNSRTQLLAKLCMVSAASREAKIGAILTEDFHRALGWLRQAEGFMPDIFREMIGKSDSQVLEELHLFAVTMFAKSKGQGVRGDQIWSFLAQRLPSEKVEKVMLLAEKASVIVRLAGTQDIWKPVPRLHGFGIDAGDG